MERVSRAHWGVTGVLDLVLWLWLPSSSAIDASVFPPIVFDELV